MGQRSHSFLRFNSRSISTKRNYHDNSSQKNSSRNFHNDFRQERGGQAASRYQKGFENQTPNQKQMSHQQSSKKIKKYDNLLQIPPSEEKVIFLLKNFSSEP